MTKLAIFGAGGLGKEALTILYAVNAEKEKYDFIGFFDENKTGEHVIGNLDTLNSWKDNIKVIVAVGSPRQKEDIISRIKNSQVGFETIVHPRVVMGDKSKITIGKGCIIGAGAILTTDVILGDHILINLNVTVGHDVAIGSYSSIMPGVNIAGGVVLEEGVFVGAGANIINSVTAKAGSTIGAGAVVVKEVEASTTVVGIPARKI
ncbi:acetyltransferase [Fulvivirga kasyanovii]|uniref:Acetyltransferase n=1 Tax=Fulvivirga kasyanovii TaxID=396812 RepID=A0ABW9RL45_9BACT|nr:NeuD/PglB/VioB family sugar acetyltransferase [Fulvivirga kasyanovii]MTI24655.1 acetyltransferase [Fulvivirga kasyanovii]